MLRTGDLAVLHNMTNLLFYDVSDPRTPRLLGRHEGVPLYWTGGTYQWNMVSGVSGSRVVVAYESVPAEVLDITDPSRPAVLSRFEPRGLVHAIAVGPTHAFVGYRHGAEGRRPQTWDAESLSPRGGIDVIDLRDPAAPRRTAGLDFDAPVTDIALAGSRLRHVAGACEAVQLGRDGAGLAHSAEAGSGVRDGAERRRHPAGERDGVLRVHVRLGESTRATQRIGQTPVRVQISGIELERQARKPAARPAQWPRGRAVESISTS